MRVKRLGAVMIARLDPALDCLGTGYKLSTDPHRLKSDAVDPCLHPAVDRADMHSPAKSAGLEVGGDLAGGEKLFAVNVDHGDSCSTAGDPNRA